MTYSQTPNDCRCFSRVLTKTIERRLEFVNKLHYSNSIFSKNLSSLHLFCNTTTHVIVFWGALGERTFIFSQKRQ